MSRRFSPTAETTQAGSFVSCAAVLPGAEVICSVAPMPMSSPFHRLTRKRSHSQTYIHAGRLMCQSLLTILD